MKRNISRSWALQLVAVAIAGLGFVGQAARAEASSGEVAYMGTLSIQNGGTMPSIIVPFNGFSFHQVTRLNLTLALLGPGGACGVNKCDTLFLNVASSSGTGGLACNVNGNLSAQQKADIVTFVSQGGKLIIYDSECAPQNYSWLPFPFTTANPGAMGATGTLSISEDNVLSSANAADPHYINAGLLGSATDAVGDMNVMTTRDANWCLDMAGTNALRVTGPVHTYARFGAGLIIYNGMDVDVLGSGTAPNAATGSGNLSKTWLQELQAAFNPTPLSDLPCGATVIGLNLTPATATNNLLLSQTSHTVTATLKDLLNNPEPGHQLTFTVVSGPNAGAFGNCNPANCITGSDGQVAYTYVSNGATGTDQIKVCTLDNAGVELCSQLVSKTWIKPAAACDVDLDGDIDKVDLSLISRARGQPASGPNDPRDADGDGTITPNDVKVCIPRCTRLSCAIQ